MGKRQNELSQGEIFKFLKRESHVFPDGLTWLTNEQAKVSFGRNPMGTNTLKITDADITSLHFIKFSGAQNTNLFFEGCTIFDFQINNETIKEVLFKNCKVSNISLNEGAKIGNLEFHGESVVSIFEIIGENSHIGNFAISESVEIKSLSLLSSGISAINLKGHAVIKSLDLKDKARVDTLVSSGKMIDFLRIEDSLLGTIRILNGAIGILLISCQSNVQSIYLGEKSEIGELHLIKKSEIKEVVFLSNSKIHTITISDSYMKRLRSEKFSEIRVVEIMEVATVVHFVMQEGSSLGMLNLKSETKLNDISITDSYCEIISIGQKCVVDNMIVNEKSFVGRIEITHNNCMSSLIVTGGCVLGDVLLDTADIGYVQISRSYCRDVKLRYCTNVTRLRIEDTWSGKLDISDCEMASVHLKNFQNSIVLEKWNISSFRVTESTLPTFSTKGQASGEIFFSDSNINHLDLRATNIPSSCSLSFVRCGVYVAQLEYLNVLGPTFFRNFRALEKPVGWLNGESSKVLGQLKKKPAKESEKYFEEKKKLLTALADQNKEILFEIDRGLQTRHPISLFSLVHSTLGKSEFSQCDFDSFSSFQYYNSKLTDCYISGSKLPRSSKIVIHDSDKVVSDVCEKTNQLMSFYNQLKRVLEIQGESVSSGRFHAKAMKQQSILLKNTNIEYDTSDNFFERTWTWLVHHSDLFTFRLNGLSSRHGDSWFRAFLFILVCTPAFFLLYNIVGAAYGLELSNPFKLSNWNFVIDGFSNTWVNKKYLFEFFLPIHRFDFMEHTISTNAWTAFIDFVSRIAIGYGIYQFIAAFRRHGRRA